MTDSGRRTRAAVGCVVAGVVGALIVPGHPAGLGLTLAMLGAGAAIVAARPSPRSRNGALYGVLAVTAAALVTVRSARWLQSVDVAAAFLLASYAVTGAGTWPAMVRAALAPIGRAFRVPALVSEPVISAGRPAWGRALPAARGASIALVLIVIFGALFVSADRAFAHLAAEAVAVDLSVALLLQRVAVFLLLMLGTGALMLCGTRMRDDDPFGADLVAGAGIGVGRMEWVIALAALDLLFAGFVAVQVAVLFGGHTHVLETAGLTYSEYAREGFFQLLFVGALTLVVVAASRAWCVRTTGRDELLLKGLLGVLCLLVLVVLASAVRRLGLYEEAFGFTRLRLAAHAVTLWLAGIFILVLAAGILGRAAWLPRAVVMFSAASLLVFNALNPDALIATRNIERFEATGRIDTYYLGSLSADAVPALTELEGGHGSCVLGSIAERTDLDPSWAAYNVARSAAAPVLEDYPGSSSVCFVTG